MPRAATLLLTRLLACLLLASLGCAGRKAAAPRYKPLAELQKCRPGECVEAEFKFRRWADAEHYRGRMPYHCTPGAELDGRPNRAIKRMIFVVHGVVGETPAELARLDTPPGLFQLRGVQEALRRAQQLDPSVDPDAIAIIAPNFQRTDEWQPYTDENKRAWTWTGSTYNIGRLAEPRTAMSGAVRTDAASSFDVLDEFLRAAVVKFPNLESVVIVGHSAGGQFVHRYVWMGVGVHERLESQGIHVRYVPANPGGYAFPIWQRKLPAGRSSVQPGVGRGDTQSWRWDTPKGCADWDDWGSGIAHLSKLPESKHGDRPLRAANYAIEHYLRPVDRKLARQALRDPGSPTWGLAARRALVLMYASREVWHIQSASDTESTFPESCKATLQGRSRFERFSNFQEAWTAVLRIPAPNLHFVALENVHPHSSRVVYPSDAGIHLLFH
jgi:hypothetical protein